MDTTTCVGNVPIGDVAVVIPAHNVAETVVEVLRQLPPFVTRVIVVEGGSSDGTVERVRRYAEQDDRVTLLRQEGRRGIAAAMAMGLEHALRSDVAIVVKMDSDGQMRVEDLPSLLYPLAVGRADYSKGNRFRDLESLRAMPVVRRFGNIAVSFLAKAATGYWNVFDPANGFVAIRVDALRQVRLSALRGYYMFEIAMLAELYLLGVVVEDVPMKSRYGNETSHLSVVRVGVTFPFRLAWLFARRLLLRYFLIDFSMVSVLLLLGVPMVVAGTGCGAIGWWKYSTLGIGAPTGAVVLPAMLIILGVQFLLSAVGEDLRNVPQRPQKFNCVSPRSVT